MELQLPERQSIELTSMATRTGRSPSELVAEAVDRFLAEDRWFREQVGVGIDQVARGEFLEEGEMDLRFARMLQS
jgi:predicted transcriptional regulator